jgi:cytochrome P450
MKQPPGPRGIELLRTIAGRRRDPVRLLADLRARYGDLVRIKVGDTSQFLVSDLADLKHVLVDNHRNYTKGPAYELLAGLLGKGLVTAEGDHWRRNRRLVQPTMQPDRVRGFVAVMAEAAVEESERLKRVAAEGPVDVYEAMMNLALRVVQRTLLGAETVDSEQEVHRALTVVLDYIEQQSITPLRLLELLPGGSRLRWLRRWVSTLPTASRGEFERAVATLDRVIYGAIERRRSDGASDGHDLVSLLLRGQTEDAERLSDVEIRDEVMTMFIAGHETTATGLTWCLYLLGLHPQHADALAAEAYAVLGERVPTVEDLPRLPLAHRVVEETLRLYPPVWRLSRFAVGPDRIGGYDVDPGSVVVVSPYLMHHDAGLWPDPERFDPDRFLPGRGAERPRLAWMPFGAGQRMCIAAAFAMAEMQVILSVLSRALTFELTTQVPPAFEARVTLRPKGGMPLRISARRREPAMRAS